MNWFRKKPLQIDVVRREESKLRLHDWQDDPRLCGIAAKVLADGNVSLMLSVLKNESPAKTALPYGVSLDDRIVMQCRSEGYEMCLANLEAMAINRSIVSLPDATFEPA